MARGFIPYSFEIGMDYPSFAQEMGTLLLEGYGELTREAFITGNGHRASRPGILTALDANTNVEVTVTTDGTFTATSTSTRSGRPSRTGPRPMPPGS